MSPYETIELSNREYELFRDLVYENSGINLGDQKMQLVQARLGKLVRAGGFRSYRAFYEHVCGDRSGRELCRVIDAISTNTTHLFREKAHFDFLAEVLRNSAEESRGHGAQPTVRIWSAACSSGEEPYSIAMTAHDALAASPQIALKILATDISSRMLATAAAGRFEVHRVGTVPEPFRRRYLVRTEDADGACLAIAPDLRRLVTFARLNLVADPFPFRHRFDVIFCRNVMIYFDRPTQERLVGKFVPHLRPGGYLIVGHSESLNAIRHSLRYVRPTIYQRPAS